MTVIQAEVFAQIIACITNFLKRQIILEKKWIRFTGNLSDSIIKIEIIIEKNL